MEALVLYMNKLPVYNMIYLDIVEAACRICTQSLPLSVALRTSLRSVPFNVNYHS